MRQTADASQFEIRLIDVSVFCFVFVTSFNGDYHKHHDRTSDYGVDNDDDNGEAKQ